MSPYIVHVNPEGLKMRINPFVHGSTVHTDIMKTQALKQALDLYGFDAAFGGARRDEEKSRAKERIFSFRSAQHHWDPKNQRPELWRVYNCRKHQRESIRVFPLSNWTELDVSQYVHRARIPVVPLYFAKERPVVERNGALSTIALPLTTIPDSLRYECMKLQEGGRAMAAVKVGVSRQVVIPKKIHDKLGLAPGDYLEVEVERGKVVMTPKTLVNKQIEKRLAEGIEDFRAGRSHGPFDSAKDAVRYLHTEAKRRRKVKAS